MSISDLFSTADVILGASPANKAGLLDLLADEAANRLGLPKPDVLAALQAREKIGSTALGRGVALPHAELRDAQAPVVLFARLGRGVNFDARDEEPVDLAFLVLWPTAARKGLLPAMSEICRALRDPQTLRRLRAAETPEEVVQLIQQATVPDPDEDVVPEGP
ncbi:PTS sugar transporter subunit IIA [Azospirillum agricola]|uniref:PTS sugar transporter subunit IIA n=1 Tax=Azospirillum agricola TaxID=1720247 RepID=UPI000A0F117F|nr:PTS sugar transporter subunit IIA [Azospirillum agricola]SMH37073.1 PTS system, nitrogen regulatory IIA component [Azospirillum lipoferum]